MFKTLLGFGGFTVVYGGCSKSVSVGLGRAELCTLNSDCAIPLVCTFAKCHAACKVTTDCQAQERCVKLPEGPVCQFVGEQTCTAASDCKGGLKCAVDYQCRAPCVADDGCAGVANQVCKSHVCADTDQLDPATGDLMHTNPNGYMGEDDAGATANDGSTPDAAAAAGSLCGDAGNALQAFHPSNLPANVPIPAVVGDWAPLGRCEVDTDAPTLCDKSVKPAVAPVVIKLSDGREALVAFVNNFTSPAQGLLNLTGKRPFIIAAAGKIEINGTIQVSTAIAISGWYGGGAPGPGTAQHAGICPIDTIMGGGARGGSLGMLLGAGGAGFCGKGGSGTGGDAGAAAATGGQTYGTPDLLPLMGGSSGGTTEKFIALVHGGGAVELVAGLSVVISDTGVIDMGAIAKGQGQATDGVGGGSGGAILLEAPSVKVNGVLAANGAGGAAYSEGASATPNDVPALGSVFSNGMTTPRAGSGSAGVTIDGGDAPPFSPGTTAGGGGGGAGRIRINTGCGGTLTVSPSAVISPARMPMNACYSEGTLK